MNYLAVCGKAWRSTWQVGILWFAVIPVAFAVIGISSVQPLQFGRFAAPGAGTVTISSLGVRSASGGVLLAGGGYAQAIFTVTGTAGAVYSISLPGNGSIVLTGPGLMTVNDFTSTPGGTGILDSTGQQSLNVGATLSVGAAQLSGDYAGSFDVIVNYQ